MNMNPTELRIKETIELREQRDRLLKLIPLLQEARYRLAGFDPDLCDRINAAIERARS